MENKEIYREKIEKKIIEVTTEGGLEFIFEDESRFKIEDHHDQDCCENVYADFSVVPYYSNEIKGKDFKEIVFKGVDKMGFLICLFQDWDKGVKIFVPCYNSQNGYYSDNLELIINDNLRIDITEFVEEDID